MTLARSPDNQRVTRNQSRKAASEEATEAEVNVDEGNGNARKRKNSVYLPEITPSSVTQHAKKSKDMDSSVESFDEEIMEEESKPVDKLDQILFNQNQIFSKLTEIRSIQDQVSSLSNRVNKNTVELNQLKSNLTTTEARVETISNDVDNLHHRTDQLEYELKKLNLTLVGFTEGASETSLELMTKINAFLSTITGQEIKVAEAVRMGPLSNKRQRTVRIRFNTMSDRDVTYNARFNTTHPTYINEDLPINMFKTLMTLKRKAKTLKSTGHQNVRINLHKSYVCTDQKIFTLNAQQTFIETDQHTDFVPVSQPSPSTSSQNPSFLGNAASNIQIQEKSKSNPQ